MTPESSELAQTLLDVLNAAPTRDRQDALDALSAVVGAVIFDSAVDRRSGLDLLQTQFGESVNAAIQRRLHTANQKGT
jgi:hypothetical protein